MTTTELIAKLNELDPNGTKTVKVFGINSDTYIPFCYEDIDPEAIQVDDDAIYL